MKEKIGFVAIGQAGGNIGKLLEERGCTVLYVNTSKEDLDTLDHTKFKYHILGGEGCNKDRHKAKQLVIDDYDNIAQEIDNKLNTDIVFCIFSSGGGTGSGAGPMLIDLLIDDGKTVGAITVIPSVEESIKSQINSYECFTELTSIEGTASMFILDNNRGDKIGLNPVFVDNFVDFLEIPDKHTSIKGNIDKAEIKEALKAHGMAVITTTKEKNVPSLIDTFRENVFAPVEPDRAIKYITLSSLDELSMNELQKAIGVPLDTYQTFNDTVTICLLSGLSFPKTRFDDVFKKIESNKEIIMKNLNATKDAGMKEDFNFLAGSSQKNMIMQPEVKPKSKRDIMKKYFS